MKKFLAILLSLLMAFTMFTACGEKQEQEEPSAEQTQQTEQGEQTEPLEWISGMLGSLTVTEEEVGKALENENATFNIIFFDDLSSMLLALQSEKIQCIGNIPESTAKYITSHNDQFVATQIPVDGEYASIEYSFGVDSNNTELCELVNKAYIDLIAEGTIDKFAEKYIDAFIDVTDEPEFAEIPTIEGADTIKVAVTGDLPPFDYVSADGKPCGFNVAVLSALSEKLNKNIELVPMNSAARATAISSGTVDMIFWLSNTSISDRGVEAPEGVTAIGPYYTSDAYTLFLKHE